MTLRSRDFWFVMALALLVLGIGLGLRDPWPADEPRFVLVAKQMVESGDLLIPHRGHEIYPDKPPLFMWLLTAAHSATGEWRIAFLLPSLLASLGTIALTFDLSLKLWGRRAARLAALMLLFAFQFTYQAKRAQIDPFLVFAMTAATHAFMSHALLAPSRVTHAAGWFMAAIGTIAKGVGALALLMLPVIAVGRRIAGRSPLPQKNSARRSYMLVGAGSAPRSFDWAWGPLAFVAAASLWLGPLILTTWLRDDAELSAYVREILLGQTARRYANPDHHFQPWWYFGEVMLTTWLPFVLAWPWALAYAWRRLRDRHDDKSGEVDRHEELDQGATVAPGLAEGQREQARTGEKQRGGPEQADHQEREGGTLDQPKQGPAVGPADLAEEDLAGGFAEHAYRRPHDPLGEAEQPGRGRPVKGGHEHCRQHLRRALQQAGAAREDGIAPVLARHLRQPGRREPQHAGAVRGAESRPEQRQPCHGPHAETQDQRAGATAGGTQSQLRERLGDKLAEAAHRIEPKRAL